MTIVVYHWIEKGWWCKIDFAGYEINVTSQTLPKLGAPWTRVDTTNGAFYFKRTTDATKTFTISGYICLSSMELTRQEAEGLNNSLAETPSGVFTDGYGTEYTCLVDDYEISPVAGVNRYTFTIMGRILS